MVYIRDGANLKIVTGIDAQNQILHGGQTSSRGRFLHGWPHPMALAKIICDSNAAWRATCFRQITSFFVCFYRSSAYLTLGISSVCLYVLHALVLCQNGCTYLQTIFATLYDIILRYGTQTALQISQGSSLDGGRHSIRRVAKFVFLRNNCISETVRDRPTASQCSTLVRTLL